MNIEKEENIVVRYIPEYIVIETRYKPLESTTETQANHSKTPFSPNRDDVENVRPDNTFEDYGEFIEYAEDNEIEELQGNEIIEINSTDFIDDTKQISPKQKCHSKATTLLNEWFLSNLHNPYPTEKEKDDLVVATNMTKLQVYLCFFYTPSLRHQFLLTFSKDIILSVASFLFDFFKVDAIKESLSGNGKPLIIHVNYWFINKRKRNKYLINNASKPSVDVDMIENLDNDLSDDLTSSHDGTTVELEVTIQTDTTRKRRQRRADCTENNLPAICDVCGKTFAQRYMLHSHLKRHDPSTWDKCPICHKSFPDGLKRHMRVHSGERPYVCIECGAAYKQAYGLTMHKAIHNDSGELYYCDTCNNGKGYRSKYALKDHLKAHYRVRNEDATLASMKSTWKPPKSCPICGFESYNIRSHIIARHTTSRPFKCEICGETFKFKKDLQTHHAYHSDEMNFKCEICEKRFKTKRKLVIHKRIHTEEKLHKCEVCSKTFLVSTYLKKHMRLHTGEKKRHGCSECSKDYSGITDLRRHLEREHGIIVQPNPKYSNNNMTKKRKIT
ncbi:Zinc finger protein [Pseudolycoriella hygida]|uniref:Zinc finger protein n=1 Tax=Pseudolycoriella hygida TaxID=35572 RepID=A0A9Q0RZI0_9DIPT|nr:Zinc finger protein [Pseudolycoriella hygida]